jgi:hypothetical protein
MGEELRIQEHFLDFLPVEQTSGEEPTKAILQEHNIPLENMRGQAYDNASNMKGKRCGVQHKILCMNSRAFFIPCDRHSLNLVVNYVAMSSKDAVSFFGVVQNIYVFSECISPSLVSTEEACYPTHSKTFERY